GRGAGSAGGGAGRGRAGGLVTSPATTADGGSGCPGYVPSLGLGPRPQPLPSANPIRSAMPVDRRITREIESGSRRSARSGASRAFPGSRRVVRRRPVAGARWDTPWFGFARASSRSGSGGRRQPPVARATAGPDPPREGASPQTVVHSCDSLPQGVFAAWQACIIVCGCPAAGTLHAPPFGLVCERVEEAAVEVAAPVTFG